MHNPEPNGQGSAARAQRAEADRGEPRKPYSFYAELWVAAFDPRPLPADPKRVFEAYAKVCFGAKPLRDTHHVRCTPRRRDR